MIWLCVACACLALTVIALVIKIAVMKSDIKSIGADFKDKTESDTNTPVTVSGIDRSVKRLAADINVALKKLRKQRLRYERGDAELKNAITGISHDLRTPLTAIEGYLELLEREKKSKTVEKYLGIIKNRTDALKQLSDELFRYSVIVSPDHGGQKERVSVNAVLEESVVGYYAALSQKNIVPKITMPSESVSRTVERAALSRVFSNLIGNAIKYSDGDLCIELNENGTLTFSNAASELTEVQVNKLFDRFYTVENARRSTGLGLSITKVLVEQMKGTISASYADGRLTIKVELPAGDGAESLSALAKA